MTVHCTGLQNKCMARPFSYSKVKVILVEDFPSIGFEGEVVDVKPKYARDFLIPNRLAVYEFPGVYNRLFPVVNEDELQQKKLAKSYENLLKKLDKSFLQIKREPSNINNLVLREALGFPEICEKIQQKYNQMAKLEHIKMQSEIIKFGFHSVPIVGVQHPLFPDKPIDFTLIIETISETKKIN